MTNITQSIQSRKTDRHVVRYRDQSGRAAMAVATGPGRKWTRLVTIDVPVRIRRVPNREQAHFTSTDYPVARAARLMLDAGTRLGITGGARRFLTEIGAFAPGSVPDRYAKHAETRAVTGPKTKSKKGSRSSTGATYRNANCARCKEAFKARRRSAKYCSAACRQKAHRRRA